jgi:CheY-like chemotaxis protein
MPGCDGIEATRRIAALDGEPVRVLVVTTFDLGKSSRARTRRPVPPP